jgi:hypothetical protein
MSDPSNTENEFAETENSAPAQPEPPFKALIDANGVLIGYERTFEDGIEVPDECDLAPGRYKWNGTSFVPILEAFTKTEVDAPDTVTAIAVALKAMRDGKPMPGITLKWLEEFDKTIDAQGA